MKNKYALYYTLNKNLDFEFTDNMESELIEKVSLHPQQKIIFHLIFEHFYKNITQKEREKIEKEKENIELPKWIIPIEVERSDSQEDTYKINLNDLDISIKKIIWKFLNLKVKN